MRFERVDMMPKLKLGFIGAGNMAGAIIGGVLKKGLMPASQIGIYDVDAAKGTRYQAGGHPVFQDAASLAATCGIIILAVKPQNFSEALSEIAPAVTKETLLVSIAAGITAQSIKKAIGFDCKVVLVMPNTPMLLGAGASALSRVEPTTPEEFERVMDIFAAGGVAREIDASKMCEVIPVNGSSPAFIYRMAGDIAESAARYGIDADAAMALFCQTLVGSAKMLMESGKSPEELITMVCSPGGTTLAAMEAMGEAGFSEAVAAAFDACVKRAKELSGRA
ncbi:MAG: pyrroline-5-carboxylate reductase [Oscillospiraceae bacterium]|jgi:pyrroline-5-carboxylate reductase|nr:pyrroline-5-carboxylate reductase [Oscillospiraceae bacterium]